MNIYKIVSALLLLVSLQAQAVTTIEWDRKPIPLVLTVGVEQMVYFPGKADVLMHPGLHNRDIFKSLFTGNTAYWMALQPFDSQRVKVRLYEGGQFILFDISAVISRTPKKNIDPINLVIHQVATAQESVAAVAPGAISTESRTNVFELIRYGVQNELAPPRLIEKVAGVHPVKIKNRSNISNIYASEDNQLLEMTASGSWSAEGLYVTSIKVRNKSDRGITLNPSLFQSTDSGKVNSINNHFLFTAMYRDSVAPQNSGKDDEVMIFIVTERPFFSILDLGKG